MINRWANTDAEWTAQRKTGISQKDCYRFWCGGRCAGWCKCCFKSLNSLSRSRYQTYSIRFKVGVVRPSQTVITGGYVFYVFFEKIQIGLSKIELSLRSTFENHQKIIPLAILCIVCSLCSSRSSRLSAKEKFDSKRLGCISCIKDTKYIHWLCCYSKSNLLCQQLQV